MQSVDQLLRDRRLLEQDGVVEPPQPRQVVMIKFSPGTVEGSPTLLQPGAAIPRIDKAPLTVGRLTTVIHKESREARWKVSTGVRLAALWLNRREVRPGPSGVRLGLLAVTSDADPDVPLRWWQRIAGAKVDLTSLRESRAFRIRFGDRRKMLLYTGIGEVALIAILMGNAMTSEPQVWLLYLVGALSATNSALRRPSREALIPRVVRHAQIPAAIAVSALAMQIGMLVGPGTRPSPTTCEGGWPASRCCPTRSDRWAASSDPGWWPTPRAYGLPSSAAA